MISVLMLRLDLAEWLANGLAMLPDWFVTLIISMTPLVELRLSLPLAIAHYNMPWQTAFIIAVIGNVIPVPFILLFLNRLERWLRRFKRWDRFFDKLFDYTRKRATKTIKRYEVIGLWLYVAIPLPVTGAWTGALIAYVFDLNMRRSFCSITAGVLTAGLIVLFLTLGAIFAIG
jgi:uncharacterized membrane protein